MHSTASTHVGSLSSGDRVQELSSKVERRSSVSELQGRENEMWEVDGGHPFMGTVSGESKHGVGILSHWRWRRCIVKVEIRNARLMIVLAEDPLRRESRLRARTFCTRDSQSPMLKGCKEARDTLQPKQTTMISGDFTAQEAAGADQLHCSVVMRTSAGREGNVG